MESPTIIYTYRGGSKFQIYDSVIIEVGDVIFLIEKNASRGKNYTSPDIDYDSIMIMIETAVWKSPELFKAPDYLQNMVPRPSFTLLCNLLTKVKILSLQQTIENEKKQRAERSKL